MKYQQPIGGAANDPYVDANPSGGIEGSPVPAAAIEHPQRELVALLVDAGLAPTDADLTQVAKAVRTLIQKQSPAVATAAGTADAITAAYTPAIAELTNGMTLYVRAGSANATTTPSFTPNSGTIAAKTIVKGAGAALVAGDISGGGHWVELQYDLTLDKWVLLNPATGVNAAPFKNLTVVTASGSFTVPAGVTLLDVELWGGGGGGGGSGSGGGTAGGGGAGGYARGLFAVTPGQVITTTIGTGGGGGGAGGGGVGGGTTSFGAFISATGGGGGQTNPSGNAGSGGAGSGGLINLTSASGQTGAASNVQGGSGASACCGGGGGGGAQGTAAAGAVPGGGGGGGGSSSGGGAGARGQINIRY